MEPGSASSAPYPGSRTEKQRYEYTEASRAGFVELSPACVMTGNALFKALRKVSGVKEVCWNTPKSVQGNVRDGQYMEKSVLVFSSTCGARCANRPMEFAITRNQHTGDPFAPFTVSVMFKDAPNGMHAEAWRIFNGSGQGQGALAEARPQLYAKKFGVAL